MLPVLIERGLLQFFVGLGLRIRLQLLEPFFTGFRDRHAGAVGNMRSLAHLDVRRRRECVGLFFSDESLEQALALLVAVVDDPRLLFLAVAGDPLALAD